jgi:non-ribosomal peptide synthase protein (TIGR01720 family)
VVKFDDCCGGDKMTELLQRLRNLPSEQRAELARQLGSGESAPEKTRLLAFIVPAEGETIDSSQLRAALSQRLPDYMLPHQIIMLDELPLTPNGKVDRESLANFNPSEREPTRGYSEPTSVMEQALAKIWSEVLGQELLSVNDNFFEIGGDSILSIQIVARARRVGIEFTPAMLFKHPTIAELASAIEPEQPEQSARGQELITGHVPLTPIQYWFFEHFSKNPAHWNQAVLLRLNKPVVVPALEAALSDLLQQHDALRTRFIEQDGKWHQEQTAMPETLPLESVDLREKPAAEQAAIVEEIATRHHRNLRLENADLMRVIHLRYSQLEEGLLIILHHLVVDGISWGLLLEDLHTALEQRTAGRPAALPPKTTSFQIWSQEVQNYAAQAGAASAANYWLSDRFRQAQQLPRDFEVDKARNTSESGEIVVEQLDEGETRSLLEDVPGVYHTQINDVLLTALAQTLTEWLQESSVLFSLEGHGREALFDGVNITRTVGWFTSVFPVRLEVSARRDLGQTLLSIKEQLRSLPDNGVGYGILKYSAEYRHEFEAFPEPEILFNYLGRRDHTLADLKLFELAADSVGEMRFPLDRRAYLIEVNCFIKDGCFQSVWNYSRHFHTEKTIQRLAERYHQALLDIIHHCRSPQAGGRSISDFPLADLDQESFDQIAGLLDD